MSNLLFSVPVFIMVYGLFMAAQAGEGTFMLSFIAMYIAIAWILYESTSTTP